MPLFGAKEVAHGLIGHVHEQGHMASPADKVLSAGLGNRGWTRSYRPLRPTEMIPVIFDPVVLS
jgi:hypothetical protein